MKKLFLFLLLLWASPLDAQIKLKQSTASTVNFKLTTIADGTDTTSATVTNITLKIIKQSDTSSSAVTSVACAASGSSNDCVEIASSGMYNAELTAANTDTLGRLDVCAVYSGSFTNCNKYEVVSASAYANLLTGGVIDSGTAQSATGTTIVLKAASAFANDELNGNLVCIVSGTGAGQCRQIDDYVSSTDTATVSTWTTNPGATSVYVIHPFPVLESLETVTDILGSPTGASLAADIATRSSPALKRNTGFQWAIQSVTSQGVPVTSGTITCTRSIDAPNSFSSTSNSPSALSADGYSEILLSAADMNGTDYVILKCANSNTSARTYYQTFRLQAP